MFLFPPLSISLAHIFGCLKLAHSSLMICSFLSSLFFFLRFILDSLSKIYRLFLLSQIIFCSRSCGFFKWYSVSLLICLFFALFVSNAWNTVVIDVPVSLSTNCVVCVIYRSVWIDWCFSSWGILSCYFACLVISYLMSGIVNFPSEAGYIRLSILSLSIALGCD